MASSSPQTTSTQAYSITLPTPFHTSPYRFIVQHTTVGPSTSLLYASIGTVIDAGTSVRDDNDGENAEKKNAYEAALEEAEGGPDEFDPSGSAGPRVDIQPGSRRLAADWACGFPPRSSNVPGTSTTLLSTPHPSSQGQGQGQGIGPGGGDDERGKNMAGRLARRTNRQIFLNLNIPHPLPSDLFPSTLPNPASAVSRSTHGMGMGFGGNGTTAAGGKDPVEAKLVLGLEKALVRVLQGDL